jgi:hypothetical protein
VADSALTPAEATAQLEAAIEHGDALGQYAPGGHPLFAAIEQARSVLSWLEEYGPAAAPVLHPGTRIYADVREAIDGIAAAEGTLRVGGDASFSWPGPATVPAWAWVAGGLGVLALGYFALYRRSA